MDILNHTHEFSPLVNPDSLVLILGSFPSFESRKAGFYYMHPKNRFWPVLSMIYGIDMTRMDIHGKTRNLTDLSIALADVIESCDAMNSLDTSLKSIVVANIPELIANTRIKQIFLNGRKADSLFRKNFPFLSHLAFYLPSTSPANAKYSLELLAKHWSIIRQFTDNH